MRHTTKDYLVTAAYILAFALLAASTIWLVSSMEMQILNHYKL